MHNRKPSQRRKPEKTSQQPRDRLAELRVDQGGARAHRGGAPSAPAWTACLTRFGLHQQASP